MLNRDSREDSPDFLLRFVQFGIISAFIGTTRTGFRGEGQRALSGTIDVFKGWIFAPFRAVLGSFMGLPETNKSDNPFRAIRQGARYAMRHSNYYKPRAKLAITRKIFQKNIFKNFFKKSCIYENNVLPL